MSKGWQTKKLGDVCEVIQRGIAPKYTENGGVCVVNQKCVRDHKINYELARQHDISLKNVKIDRYIKKGDVLVNSTGTGTLGRLAQVRSDPDKPTTVDTHVTIVRPVSGKFYDDFFGYMLIKIEDEIALSGEGASGQTELSRNTLRDNLMVSFPVCTQEQKRIVAILDQAFADIEKLRANTERNLKNARELFESYAKKVLFSTARGWIESTIGKECNLMTGGTPSKTEKKYFDNGTIRWLVSGDVHKGIIEDCEGRITKLGLANSNAKYLPTNSVVIALNGQGKTRGTVALLKVEATCNQSIVSIFPKESSGIFSEYILLNLQSRYNEIRKMTGDSGNDRRGLNMPLIRSIKISFPSSYEEQQNMIRKLTILKELNNDLVLRYQEKINYLDQLKKSILQKAFTGQLTKHEVTV